MPDGKEKPVGKDSVPKVNCGGRHWPDHVGFGGRNAIVATRLPYCMDL